MVVSVKRNIIAIIIVNQIARIDLTNKINLTEAEYNKQKAIKVGLIFEMNQSNW
jgi:hypothetical protein